MKTSSKIASVSAFLLLLAACAPSTTVMDDAEDAEHSMALEDEDVDMWEEESADQDQANSAMAADEDTEGFVAAGADEEDVGEDSADDKGDMMEDDTMMEDDKGVMDGDTAMTEPRILRISVTDWEFNPASLQIKKGENVVLELSGDDGNHGIAIPGLGINEVVAEGETIRIELPTDTAGTFDAFCNVPCGPGHKDMKAKFIIS